MAITILYGSQTGNAEDMSKRIGYKAKSLGYRVLVEAADDFPLRLLPKQSLLIFVCSTTGHGQEPENMKNFYNFMRRRDLPKECLSNIKYAVYGIGDSSYAKFNYVSKILYKRLKECGAQPLQELVAADEQHRLGCDGIIYPKLEELWSSLCHVRPDSPTDALPDSSYDAIFNQPDTDPLPDNIFTDEFSSRYHLRSAVCVANRRVTSESHFQDTRFLCFRAEENMDYEPGDVCSILPANTYENAIKFVELLRLDPNQRFSLRKKDSNFMVNYLYDFVPDGLRIIDLVKYYLDIQSVPRRSFFEFLWPFSDDELERGKLQEFASTEGQEEMFEYCVLPKRSILEVLQDFPKTIVHIKFEYLFDLIPPIKPRSFSIASAPNMHPNEVQLIVGVVKYKTRLRKTRKGLCSNYLASIVPITSGPEDATIENKLRFFIKRSSFKLPHDDSVPIVLVGPGLGIAPFRSFIEDRSLRKIHKPIKTHLYFGCRYRNADFYFKDELENFVSDGSLRLRVAFSREDSKRHVQDLLNEDSELIRRLIVEENAIVYVAGNSKLPEDLRSIIEKILADPGDGDTTDSSDSHRRVASLEANNRVQYDCW